MKIKIPFSYSAVVELIDDDRSWKTMLMDGALLDLPVVDTLQPLFDVVDIENKTLERETYYHDGNGSVYRRMLSGNLNTQKPPQKRTPQGSPFSLATMLCHHAHIFDLTRHGKGRDNIDEEGSPLTPVALCNPFPREVNVNITHEGPNNVNDFTGRIKRIVSNEREATLSLLIDIAAKYALDGAGNLFRKSKMPNIELKRHMTKDGELQMRASISHARPSPSRWKQESGPLFYTVVPLHASFDTIADIASRICRDVPERPVIFKWQTIPTMPRCHADPGRHQGLDLRETLARKSEQRSQTV